MISYIEQRVQRAFSTSTTKSPEAVAREREVQETLARVPRNRFMRGLSSHLTHVEGKFWTLDGKLMCEFDDTWGMKLPELFLEHTVLLKSVFVWKEYRGHGLLQSLLDMTKANSISSGASVIAVSNPFTLHDPEDPYYLQVGRELGIDLATLNEGTRTETWVKGTGFELLKDYKKQQLWMSDRLRKNGFKNVDISEAIGDRVRCPTRCCHIYVPPTADPEFTREIKRRTFE